MQKDILVKALQATRETKSIEFKAFFDVTSPGEWCEIIKDIIAIANSGGGIILFGVNDDGTVSKFNVGNILKIDHADVVTKLHKYTGVHFTDFEILEKRKGSHRIAAFLISDSSIPLVFVKPGTYDIGGGKQKTAFGQGTIYFRHGAKSEHGTSDDIRKCLDRQLSKIKKQWISGVRKVVTAPPNTKVVVVNKDVQETDSEDAMPVRVVDDPAAPAFLKINPGKSHPYLIDKVAKEIKEQNDLLKFGRYEILAVRYAENIDEITKPDLIYRDKVHKYYSPQYSQKFIDFVSSKLSKNKNYVQDCVEKYKRYMSQKNKKK